MLALFAADPVCAAENAAVIAVGGAVVAAFFTYLTARSNSANDRDKAVMARDLADAKADLAAIKADLEESKRDRAEMRGRLEECERDRGRLNAEIDEQRRLKHDALGREQELLSRVAALELRAAAPG